MSHQEVTLLYEILEQPALLAQVLARSESPLPATAIPLPTHQRIVALAEGSSKHALEITAPFIEHWVGLPMQILDPETLEEKALIARQFGSDVEATAPFAYDPAHDFWVIVSQSGTTASVLDALDTLEATCAGPVSWLALTNQPESTLARRATAHLPIEAGPEASIAATKTLTATVMRLLCWALNAGYQRGRLSEAGLQAARQRLSVIPKHLEALWEPERQTRLHHFARKLKEVNHFVLLSKGPLTLVLPEAGLKLTETSRNIVYTDNTESFKHGPKVMLAGVNDIHPNAVYIVPQDPIMADALFHDIQSHFWIDPFGEHPRLAFEDDRVFFVMFEGAPPLPERFRTELGVTDDRVFMLPNAGPLEARLLMVLVAFQLISYHLAMIKGDNPNDPTLNKSVLT